MSKNRIKITDRKQFSADERDDRFPHYTAEATRMMHVCRHSGSPDVGLLIGRSLFPVLVSVIHRRMVTTKQHGCRTLPRMLEDLHTKEITDEATHIRLRRAAASLGEFGSGRDLQHVMEACDVLRRITTTAAFKDALNVRRLAKATKAIIRRPSFMERFTTAATFGLVTFGASS